MKTLLALLLICNTLLIAADKNDTAENNKTSEAIKKAMEKEQKYAKEQKFYTGKEYDLKGAEVDPEVLKKIEKIEPDYDFDMSTGVYDD